jgi:hypothetical protein
MKCAAADSSCQEISIARHIVGPTADVLICPRQAQEKNVIVPETGLGKQSYTFTAQGKGKATLTFIYRYRRDAVTFLM